MSDPVGEERQEKSASFRMDIGISGEKLGCRIFEASNELVNTTSVAVTSSSIELLQTTGKRTVGEGGRSCECGVQWLLSSVRSCFRGGAPYVSAIACRCLSLVWRVEMES